MVWPKSNTQIIDRERMYVHACVCLQLGCSAPDQSSHSFIHLPVKHVCLKSLQNDPPNHRECSVWMLWHLFVSYALKYFIIYSIFLIIWNCTSNDYCSWYLSLNVIMCLNYSHVSVPDGVACCGDYKKRGINTGKLI